MNIFKRAWQWIVVFYKVAIHIRKNDGLIADIRRELDDTNPDLKTRMSDDATTEPGAHALGDGIKSPPGREDS